MNNYENRQGKLFDAFQHFNPTTLQHAAEINHQRLSQEDLRKVWFWVADHTLWDIEGQELVFYLGTRETNPVFKNIKKATEELITKHKYAPPKDVVDAVINAKSTVKVRYSELRLKRDETVEKKYPGEFFYFEFDPESPDINDEEMKIVSRGYGQNEVFFPLMELFKVECRINPRIYLLAHDYACSQIRKYGQIARVCRLTGIRQGSQFLAAVRCVNEGDEPTRKLFFRGILK